MKPHKQHHHHADQTADHHTDRVRGDRADTAHDAADVHPRQRRWRRRQQDGHRAEGGQMHHHHHAPHSRGGRRRARRGAVLNAALLLLDERPMHGYELISEMEARSGGRWRPSPGAMYPALSRMEEHGLVTSVETDGKKQFSLTAQGRRRLAEYRDAQGDDAVAPWDDVGTGRRGDLRSHVAELVGQARQIGRFGSSEQIEQAGAVLGDAKRRLYTILAAENTKNTENAETTEREHDAAK